MTEAPIKLAGYFLEWQLIEDAKADLADRSKDLFKAMKDDGFDTKAARVVFREKRSELSATTEDVAKAEEAEAIQDLYRAALDSGLTARAGRARESTVEELIDRSRGYYQTWLKTPRAHEPVDIISSQDESFVTSHHSSTDVPAASPGDKIAVVHSQWAESPTADKPEAHAQPLSDASGSLSEDFDPSKLWLNQSGRAA